MAAEGFAIWGCDKGGQLDLWNCARTFAYLRRHGVQAHKVRADCCADATPFLDLPDVGVDPSVPFYPDYDAGEDYRDPVSDNAWWVSDQYPESSGFYGLQVTRIDGLYGNTILQEAFSASGCGNNITYLPQQNLGMTLTVEGVLHGSSCCSVSYGLRALRRALQSCCTSDCGGVQLRIPVCTPDPGVICGDTDAIPPQDVDPWRTINNAKVAELPSIIDRTGPACGSCGCSPLTRVMFTIRADGEMYRDPSPVVTDQLLIGGDTTECRLACPEHPESCEHTTFDDPNCDVPILVAPPQANTLCTCTPLIQSQTCFELDLGDGIFDSELEFIIKAGDQDLRNLKISIWRYVVDPNILGSAYYNECNTCKTVDVGYVPQGTVLRSGPCGTTITRGLTTRPALNSIAISGGANCTRLGCGRYYVCIAADVANTGQTASVSVVQHVIEP